MTEDKVSREAAEADFDRFLEEMDLDVDTATMDDEDLKSFRTARNRLVREIMRGNLIVDDSGQPTYSPKDGESEPITFYEPRGDAYMAMDSRKKNHDVSKMFAVMAAITKQPMVRFSKMRNRDLKICQAITLLFIG